jgi:3',5'-cyclic AMP phosphodiesterase CpdA
MRLFATSDLHSDYKENFNWLTELSDTAYRDDALIVAGDVSDRLDIIRETLLLLRAKFRHVLFTPGNHELWVRNV